MTEFRNDREGLLNKVERRHGAERLEFREDKSSGQVILQGYAATFEPYDVHGGPTAGGWVEQLSGRAFDETLAEQPDVQLLINHGGTPLARTKSGTLKLTRDGHGLRVWASLDASDPDVQALVPKMRRGDMDEMSFAFRVTDQTWDTSYSNRTINSLSLEKGDVSVVNYGMNPTTKVVIADAVGKLSQLCSEKDLVELRSLDHVEIQRAVAVLQSIAGPGSVPGLGGIRPQGVSRKDGGKEPYGDVKYADPGYQSDGKKRYPLDTADHVRSAWSYINMPKNQKAYSSTQVNSIKSRIKSRAKELGIKIADAKGEAGLPRLEQHRAADGSLWLMAVMADGVRVPVVRSVDQSDDPHAGHDCGEMGCADPHEEPFEVGPMGLVNAGPVPDNIMGGGDTFTAQPASFTRPSPEPDPHDAPTEEQLSMDHPSRDSGVVAGSKITPVHAGGGPQDTPYSVDALGGGERDVTDNGNISNAKVAPAPGTPPSVGTAPVLAPGGQAYDWSSGTCEPSEPAQELDAAVRAMDECDDDMGECADKDKEDKRDDGGDEEYSLDLGLVEALEKTIVHAYKLSEGSAEVRQALVIARKQLLALVGKKPSTGPTPIDSKLSELRKEVGAPDTGTVSEGLAYLRSEGSAPVGYRGLLDQDPTVHITTPAERLAREAQELRDRALLASGESDKAEQRLKEARREAELNAVIRRHHQKG